MSCLTNAQPLEIGQFFYRNNNFMRTVYGLSRDDYDQFIRLKGKTIRYIAEKKWKTLSIRDTLKRAHHHGVCSGINIAAISDSVKLSILRHSHSLAHFAQKIAVIKYS